MYPEETEDERDELYVCAQIMLDIEQPLIPKVIGRVPGFGSVSVSVVYENLPSFCYVCGVLGHQECECPVREVSIENLLEHNPSKSLSPLFRFRQLNQTIVVSSPRLMHEAPLQEPLEDNSLSSSDSPWRIQIDSEEEWETEEDDNNVSYGGHEDKETGFGLENVEWATAYTSQVDSMSTPNLGEDSDKDYTTEKVLFGQSKQKIDGQTEEHAAENNIIFEVEDMTSESEPWEEGFDDRNKEISMENLSVIREVEK